MLRRVIECMALRELIIRLSETQTEQGTRVHVYSIDTNSRLARVCGRRRGACVTCSLHAAMRLRMIGMWHQ